MHIFDWGNMSMRFILFMWLILFIIISAVFFSACDNSNPSDTNLAHGNDFLPGNAGSFCTYDLFIVDSEEQITEPRASHDTVYLNNKEMKLDQLAAVYTVNRYIEEAFIDSFSYYMYENDNRIYTDKEFFFFLFSDMPFQMALNIPDAWYLVADAEGYEWEVLDLEIDDMELEMMGFNITLNGKIEVDAERRLPRDFTVKNNSLSADEFRINYKLTLSGKADNFPLPIEIETERTSKLYFKKGIGLICINNSPGTINNPLMQSEFDYDGSYSILKDYKFTD